MGRRVGPARRTTGGDTGRSTHGGGGAAVRTAVRVREETEGKKTGRGGMVASSAPRSTTP